jgi:hypothetical protein
MTTSKPMLVHTEAGYDLIRAHFDLILELQITPLPAKVVAARMQDNLALQRLIKHGILRQEHEKITAGSAVIRQLRREGMVAFLEKYVWPAILANLQNKGHTHARLLALAMPPSEIGALRGDAIAALLDHLASIPETSDEDMNTTRLTVSFVGATTSMTSGDDKVRCAQLLRVACEQRAIHATPSTAVLTQFDCLANHERFQATLARIHDFCDVLDSKWKNNEQGNFHLLVTTHWQQTCGN